MPEVIKLIARNYGKAAFGTVVLIAIWQLCVLPTLELSARAQAQAVTISEHFRASTESIERTAGSVLTAATVLERVELLRAQRTQSNSIEAAGVDQ